jgi:hypothetical protein
MNGLVEHRTSRGKAPAAFGCGPVRGALRLPLRVAVQADAVNSAAAGWWHASTSSVVLAPQKSGQSRSEKNVAFAVGSSAAGPSQIVAVCCYHAAIPTIWDSPLLVIVCLCRPRQKKRFS